MVSERLAKILRSKADLSEEQLSRMSDAEGWNLVYSLKPQKSTIPKRANQICFTGFSPAEKERLGHLAASHGLDVVKSVTQSLAFLCTGPNAGPSKIKKAKEQEVIILNEEQFAKFLSEGEIPLTAS